MCRSGKIKRGRYSVIAGVDVVDGLIETPGAVVFTSALVIADVEADCVCVAVVVTAQDGLQLT